MENLLKNIKEILENLTSSDDLKKLFIEVLNFENITTNPVNIPNENEIQNLILDLEIIAKSSPTLVFYIKTKAFFDGSFYSERIIRSMERKIVNQIFKNYHQSNLFIFSDKENSYWDFVYPINYGRKIVLKRFNINPDNRSKLRTPVEQLSKLFINPKDNKTIFERLELTFNTEAVSESFYKDYIKVFNNIKENLLKQLNDNEKIHWFTHQLLNRLMFLYFVQKRDVFGKNKNFLAHFWNIYRNYNEGKNEFYEKWLKVLFFEALNGRFYPKDYFKIDKIDLNNILQLAPHLNGGLFKENPEFDYIDVKVNDDLFIEIFEFLESYNFTVRESTPLEEDLEIDPEMLGNIYEMIVNVSDNPKEDEQHKAGIFYTPKTEIDFMIRRSLVELLFNKTKISKEKLYQFVFPELDEEIIPYFSKEEIQKIYKILDEITIIDPACGSGHYLVVATQIIFELKKILWKKLGNDDQSFNAFEEKLKIIENSIFGVDIKDWAVEIAKLRLWLDLMISAKDEDFYPGGKALLPNLTFKIRIGDSLVQEIGGIFFRVREIKDIPVSLRALKNQLIEAKKDYFYNKKPEQWVKSRELEFFKALLEDKINNLKKEKSEIEKKKIKIQQFEFDKEKIKNNLSVSFDNLSKSDEEKLNSINEQIKILNEEKEKLSLKRKFAFWAIEFSEILSGEKEGFDIVIANPPYVRQEAIVDLIGGRKPKEYKNKLIEQTQLDWASSEFDKNSPIPQRFDKRCDLYVYFYLKGLKLLSPDGILCYISSNAWLDVGYGKILQE
ncbi:MAG: Eco57I restriction-modification methylase domain-containing protein, partial [Minisyncoccia bacterium]